MASSWLPQSPALRTLGATIAFAFAGQAAVASIAVPLKTEKYYDLAGSLGFLSCTAMSLYFPYLRARWAAGRAIPIPPLSSFHSRQLIMSGMVTLWAGRLGTFLFQRIRKSGSDSRFDDIKPNPIKFFGAWMAQAMWISITAFPVFAVNSIPAKAHPALGVGDYIGLALWIAAFLFEVTADRQKSAWREEREKKQHDEKFISRGLWSVSRHPNYVGEVSMWIGLGTAAASALSRAGGALPAWAIGGALLSPLFEYLLITQVSGVPMLEQSGDKKWGDDKDWQAYKEKTPVFWPKMF